MARLGLSIHAISALGPLKRGNAELAVEQAFEQAFGSAGPPLGVTGATCLHENWVGLGWNLVGLGVGFSLGGWALGPKSPRWSLLVSLVGAELEVLEVLGRYREKGQA